MPDVNGPLVALPLPPRRVSLTKRARITQIVTLVILVCIGVAMLVAGNFQADMMRQLRDKGVLTQANIVDKDYDRGAYDIRVRYTANGVPRRKWIEIGEKQYHAITVGEILSFTYLPLNPTVVEIGPVTEANVRKAEDLLLGMMLLYIPFAAFVYWLANFRIRRERRFVRWGLLAEATITDNWRGADGQIVQYRYRVDGVDYVGKGPLPAYVNAMPDAVVPVLYLTRRPRSNMLLDGVTRVQPGR